MIRGCAAAWAARDASCWAVAWARPYGGHLANTQNGIRDQGWAPWISQHIKATGISTNIRPLRARQFEGDRAAAAPASGAGTHDSRSPSGVPGVRERRVVLHTAHVPSVAGRRSSPPSFLAERARASGKDREVGDPFSVNAQGRQARRWER